MALLVFLGSLAAANMGDDSFGGNQIVFGACFEADGLEDGFCREEKGRWEGISRLMEKLRQHSRQGVPKSAFRIGIRRKKGKRLAIFVFLCGAYKELIRLTLVFVVWASLGKMMPAGLFFGRVCKNAACSFREFNEAQWSNFAKCCRRLTESIYDAGFVEVVRRHFDFDAVSDGQSDESLPHLAGDVSEHHVAVVQFDAEHGSRQDCFDFSFQFDVIFHPLL